MKKWVIWLMVLVIAAAGCLTVLLTRDSDVPQVQFYMYVSTSDPDAIRLIGEELDAYVYEKLGFHVAIHAPDDYEQTVTSEIRKGTVIDVAQYYYNIPRLAKEGLLLPLDELLKSHGQGILRTMKPAYLEDNRLDGQLYTLPTNRDRHCIYGFVYDLEIAERYGLDLSAVKTPADLTAVFAQLKEQAPDITPTVIRPVATRYGIMDGLGDHCGVLKIGKDPTIVNPYETPEFEELAQLIYQWNQAGYLVQPPLDSTSISYYLSTGKVFGALDEGHTATVAEENRATERRTGFIPMSINYKNSSNASRMGYVIPSTSAHPEEAMALLELMYTDTHVANLLLYGVEGVHYVRSEEDPQVLCWPENRTPEYYKGIGIWHTCNWYIADRWEGCPADLWQRQEQANETALRSPGIGFVFDSTPVSRQLQACREVVNTYLPTLQAGILDPAQLLPELQAALHEAGIDAVIEEKQRQLDQYLLRTGG